MVCTSHITPFVATIVLLVLVRSPLCLRSHVQREPSIRNLFVQHEHVHNHDVVWMFICNCVVWYVRKEVPSHSGTIRQPRNLCEANCSNLVVQCLPAPLPAPRLLVLERHAWTSHMYKYYHILPVGDPCPVLPTPRLLSFFASRPSAAACWPLCIPLKAFPPYPTSPLLSLS